MKTALITGITGQDGSYLAEFLLEKGMMYMALFDVIHLTIVSVLFNWKANPIFIFILDIWEILCPL